MNKLFFSIYKLQYFCQSFATLNTTTHNEMKKVFLSVLGGVRGGTKYRFWHLPKTGVRLHNKAYTKNNDPCKAHRSFL